MSTLNRLVFLLAFVSASVSSGATRYAGDFLAVGVSPRATGMGSAVTAIVGGPEASYWNPAGLAAGTTSAPVSIAMEHAERFGGVVKHDAVSAAIPLSRSVLGVFLFRGAVDGIIFADSTTLVDPSLPLSESNMPDPSKTRTFSNADYVIHVATGHTVTRTLRVGAGVKLVRRTIGGTGAFGYGVDLGVQWEPRPQIAVGMLVRDVTTTRVNWDNSRTDVVHPTVHTGAAFSFPFPRIGGRLVVAGNSTVGSESGGYGGFGPWRVLNARNVANLGAEYEWRETIALRLGSQNVRGMLGPGSAEATAGMGLRGHLPWFSGVRRVGVDLAWIRHTLRDSFRLGATVEW